MDNASSIVDNGVSQIKEFETIWQDYIEKVVYGQMTPEAAGQSFYDDMINVLDELKSFDS